MRWGLLFLLISACSNDDRANVDAAVGSVEDATPDSAPDATPLTLDCASYCAGITAACQDGNEQYETEANCLSTCMQIDTAGMLSDMMGNTLGCRIYHVELARTDPTTHCPHAGPSGGGACGMRCNAACDLIPDLCPSLPGGQWGGQCATNCASTGTAFTGTYSTTTAMTGNTIECRIYQATVGNCAGASRTASTTCQ